MPALAPDEGRQLAYALRVAQVLGVSSTAFFCGKTFSQSFSTTPALLHAPAPLLAKQWKTMFDSDKLMAPIVVLLSTGIFSYLGYKEPVVATSHLYSTSAAMLVACVPYTLILMEPINQLLESKAEELTDSVLAAEAIGVGSKSEDSVHQLVDRWATFNLGRTVLTGLSTLIATWAAISGGPAGVPVGRVLAGRAR